MFAIAETLFQLNKTDLIWPQATYSMFFFASRPRSKVVLDLRTFSIRFISSSSKKFDQKQFHKIFDILKFLPLIWSMYFPRQARIYHNSIASAGIDPRSSVTIWSQSQYRGSQISLTKPSLQLAFSIKGHLSTKLISFSTWAVRFAIFKRFSNFNPQFCPVFKTILLLVGVFGILSAH